jgi:hypothetical protein|tara:strand:- start:538 stop:747 length:210 start_codon:yes stop_codon:yes gene_type:complete
MKFLTVFIILVTIDGYQIKDFTKDTKDTCFESGDKIIKEIANYYDERNNNPKLQGWYTPTGALVFGFYC